MEEKQVLKETEMRDLSKLRDQDNAETAIEKSNPNSQIEASPEDHEPEDLSNLRGKENAETSLQSSTSKT